MFSYIYYRIYSTYQIKRKSDIAGLYAFLMLSVAQLLNLNTVMIPICYALEINFLPSKLSWMIVRCKQFYAFVNRFRIEMERAEVYGNQSRQAGYSASNATNSLQHICLNFGELTNVAISLYSDTFFDCLNISHNLSSFLLLVQPKHRSKVKPRK